VVRTRGNPNVLGWSFEPTLEESSMDQRSKARADKAEREWELYLAQLMELRQWLKAGRMDLPWEHLDRVVSKWAPKGAPRALRRSGVRRETLWTEPPKPLRNADGHEDRVDAHRKVLRKQVRSDDRQQKRTDHVRMVWRDSKGRALRLDANFKPYYEELERPKAAPRKEVEAEVTRREKGSQYWAPAQYDPTMPPQSDRGGKQDKKRNCKDREWIRQCGVFGSKI
jgi:hypothetical protein